MTVAEATTDYEAAAHLLALIAEHPPATEPRPPRWRPLARLRHLREHDDALALWAEGVEDFAREFRGAEATLERARWAEEVFG